MTSSDRKLFAAWVTERDMRQARMLRAMLGVNNAELLREALAALREDMKDPHLAAIATAREEACDV